MEAAGTAQLGWFDGKVAARRSADMRYGEQVFEIAVPLDGEDLAAPDARAAVAARFHRRHAALFTYALPDQEVVLTTARVAVVGMLPRLACGSPPSGGAVAGSRRIHVGGAADDPAGGWVEVPVHGFGGWGDGWLDGPGLVVSATTTVLVRPGDRARMDARGWLEIEVAAA